MFHKMPCFGVIKRNHLVKNAFFGNGQAPDDLSPLPIEHPAAHTPRSLTWYLLVVPRTSLGPIEGDKGQIMAQNLTWFCITVNSSFIFFYIFLQLYQVFIIWIVQHFVTTDL